MGFHEIAKYYYSPGWHEPGTMLEFFINKSLFERLPSDLQGIITTAGSAVAYWVFNEMEARNARALADFLEMGVDIRQFPAEVLRQLRVYTQEALSEITNRDPFSQKVYASYRDFQRRAANYSIITEKAYYGKIQSEGKLKLR